jgi:ArsR family transcriptional regulator
VRDVAEFFKALADEARLRILWLLLNHEELCVCDVMAALGITQSKASRHLGTLRHAGLVTDRREGMWSYYSLGTTDHGLAKGHLHLLRVSLAKRPDATALLAKLHARLDAKHRAAVCVGEGACAATKKNPPKRPRRIR